MKIIYEEHDITKDVDVKHCIHKDVSGGRRDLLDIEFEYSEKWFGWQPQRDDTIRIEMDGYSTGNLYVNTVLPENGWYRILATGTTAAARRKAFSSYEKKTLQEIMSTCAGECGMSTGLYGVSGSYRYDYLIRPDTDAMTFLDQLLTWEGARLKCLNGKLRGIGIAYAQGLGAGQLFELEASQMQSRYIRREDIKYSGVTVATPFAKASAFDSAAGGGPHITLTHLPAMDDVQAGRWARGILLNHNRTAETLEVGMEFNAGLTALARVDIKSNTDADGQWVADEVEHDFILRKTRATLLRCITTIR